MTQSQKQAIDRVISRAGGMESLRQKIAAGECLSLLRPRGTKHTTMKLLAKLLQADYEIKADPKKVNPKWRFNPFTGDPL